MKIGMISKKLSKLSRDLKAATNLPKFNRQHRMNLKRTKLKYKMSQKSDLISIQKILTIMKTILIKVQSLKVTNKCLKLYKKLNKSVITIQMKTKIRKKSLTVLLLKVQTLEKEKDMEV